MKIYQLLADYCATKNYDFIWGLDAYYQNLETNKSLGVNKPIVLCEFKVSCSVSGPHVTHRYVGSISIGRKFESVEVEEIVTNTESNLDETFKQKYDRRLLELSEILEMFVTLFSCEKQFKVPQFEYDFEINKFDEVIDFVSALVTFEEP